MKFHVVTTCSRRGWDEYGQRMHASFLEHWPHGLSLDVYSEDVIPDVMTRTFPNWLFAFKERHLRDRKANGYINPGPYNYRFDAVRFAHKTAAVIGAVENGTAEFVIWLDADTVTHSPVTLEFLETLAPLDKHGISWLSRKEKYPECGFYILRREHPGVQKLIAYWKGLYKRDMVFHLSEWHDSFVLQELVRLFGVPTKSISGPGEYTSHPFINGPLGAVMDHLKGPRKLHGRSNARDLKIARPEEYWKCE